MIDRLRSESGFTLIELMLAMTLGLLVLGAAGVLLSVASTTQRKTSDRLEAVGKGRLVIDQMTSQLRSQVCIGPSDPDGRNAAIQDATGDSVTFYASIASAPTRSGIIQIDKRTLRFVPTAPGASTGQLVEDVYTGTQATAGTPPTFPVNPSRTRVLAPEVSRGAPGAPIFRFFKYRSDLSPQTVELTPPINIADRELMVRVDIAFDAYPAAGADPNLRTVFADQAYVRTADPTDPTRTPKCI